MRSHRAHVLHVVVVVAAALVAAGPLAAQTAVDVPSNPVDARQTRDQLTELLRRVPPELGQVLKLDPSLVGNQTYLAAYPELAAFIDEHPEIATHPGYFFEYVSLPATQGSVGPAARMAMEIMGAMAAMTVFLVVTGVLAWLVKTIVAQRRWKHLAAVQTDVHNKILDRLGSSNELLAYIQSPAGRRFLESAPIPVDDDRVSPRAPVARLLWSVQAGVVLIAAGIGMQFISRGVPPGASEPLLALGILGLSVGIGFVVSAIAGFVVTRRLGLWSPGTGTAAAPAGDGGTAD